MAPGSFEDPTGRPSTVAALVVTARPATGGAAVVVVNTADELAAAVGALVGRYGVVEVRRVEALPEPDAWELGA